MALPGLPGLPGLSGLPATQAQCPPGSLQSFPIGLDVTPSLPVYTADTIKEQIMMDFQWQPRTTPPSFLDTSSAGGTLDETGAGSQNESRIRYRQESYSLYSAQLCAPTHKSWLISQTEQIKNSEDFICTFEAPGEDLYKYLTFVIPLIRTDTKDGPDYLEGIADESRPGPFSLEDMFPKDKNTLFATYATCLQGTGAASRVRNMYVFVSTAAVEVPAGVMAAIADQAKFLTGKSFPPFTFPFGTRQSPSQISVSSNFSTYVRTTDVLLNLRGASQSLQTAARNERDDTTDAYKCIPLDPDRDVVDGTIAVDTRKGTLLSDVLREREEAKGQPVASVGPGRIEKYLGSALGVLLSVILFGGAIYVALDYFLAAPVGAVGAIGAVSASAPEEAPWKSIFKSLPIWIIIGVLAGFVGLVVGLSLA